MSYPISDVTRRVVYSGSAGTGPYSFSFEVLANTDIAVYKNTTLLTLTTDYTVTINSNGTGSVTLVSAATGSDNITLVGNRSIERATDFVTGGDLFANTLNDEFDSLVIFAQQIKEEAARGLKAPITDPTDVNMVLPIKSSRKGKVLAFDSTTGDPVNGPALDSMVTVIEQSDNINTVADSIADVNTVAADIADVSTVAGIAGNVTTVAGIAANVTTVAGIDTEVTTVAGISANVTTVAGISSAVSTVAANITDIQNAEENADAAATSASAASTSATNAASSASAASTSASNASSSASAASTSASNASSSATAAASSAAAAAASLDSFDDRYLGAKSSDPTLDNDGNALVTGALYYNTTSQTMKVYDGANWITATAAGTTAMNVYKYVATAGQTTFSGAATVGGTMSYTSGNIIVFLNGAALDSTDYTATNGTSVVLGSAASLNDEVVVVAFKSFTVADTYTQSAADAEFLRKAGEDGVTVSSGNVGIGCTPTQKLSIQPATYRKINILEENSLATIKSVAPDASDNNRGMSLSGEYIAVYTGASSGTSVTERMRIDSSGNLLVGITSTSSSPTYGGVYVVGDRNTGSTNYYAQMFVAHHSSTNHGIVIKELASSGIAAAFLNSSGTAVGQINTTASATSYATSSDYRLKENIAPMTGALATVGQLKPVTYNWKATGEATQGFIAHELQAVVPDCVTGEKDAVDADGNPVYQGIDTSFLVATLTAAIQEQQAIIEQLKADVAELKGQA